MLLVTVTYLSRYTNKKQPRLFGICSVIDYLATIQTGMSIEHFYRLRVTLNEIVNNDL